MSTVTDPAVVVDVVEPGAPESLVVPREHGNSRRQASAERRELRSGLIGVVLLVAAMIATGVVYTVPWGETTYHATLSEAQSVRVGDEVRVAGINVGTVTSLKLLDSHVEMDFTVKDSVFVGDQTTIDIRMLTLVGGHYLALAPAGRAALGRQPIATDRITMPYSLLQTMQDAAEPVGRVDGDTVRMNIVALNQSLRSAPESLRNIGRAAESLVAILNRQNDDVSKALAVAEEYLAAVDANKSLLGEFVRKLGKLTRKLLDKKAEIEVALTATGEMLYRIAALEPSSRTYLEPVLDTLNLNRPHLEELLRKYNGLIGSLQNMSAKLVRASAGKDGLVIDQSAATLSASPGICVPLPGRGC